MDWTNEQKDAINYRDGSAIVSAAAGSGKTAILVERILSIISNEADYTPADEIIVVTFTKKAAAELRARLNKAIAEAAEKNGSEFLRNQLIRFQSAVISTISSFCLEVIRNNIQKADLPVNFTVLDDSLCGIMLENAVQETLNRFHEEFPAEKVSAVCNCFVDRDDKMLGDHIKRLRSFMSNLTEPSAWRDEQLSYYSDIDKGYEHFNSEVRKKAKEIADSAAMKFMNLITIATENELDAVLTALKKDSEKFTALPKLLDRGQYAALADLLSIRLSTFKKEWKDSIVGSYIFDKRDELNKAIKTIPDYIFNKIDFKSDCDAQRIIIETLFELCDVLEEEYTKLKQVKNGIDFNDIERKMLTLLKDKEFAERLASEYSCIIVDEFQDTNDLQFEIFKKISRNESNLFFVGDVKQSIYGFRAANPKNFAAICKNKRYKCLPLNSNFRSRREVVETVNAVFTNLMTEDCGDVNYDKSCRLNYGAKYDEGDNYRTELHYLRTEDYMGEDTDDMKKTISEAMFVTEKISEMLDTGFRVQDKNGGLRPCRKGDFCILLRSVNGKARIFVDKLKEAGIEAHSDSIKDYFALHEVSLIIDFLTVIDNPMKDKQLLSVLMSPLYMMTAEEAARVRLGISGFDTDKLEEKLNLNPLYDAYSNYSLYSCVSKCASPFKLESDAKMFSENDMKTLLANEAYVRKIGDEKCKRFMHDFLELRTFMANNSIERLVRKIYDSTDFLSVISVYEYSGQKVANLRRFLSYVSGFENGTGGTLSDFLRYINDVREKGSDITGAGVVTENDNAVSVMTMHGSKGLEFPICFLCDMGKDINKKDETGNLIFNIKQGIGMKYVDRNRLVKFDTLPLTAVKLDIDKQTRSDEMRLLYVAMTRAREKLIITSCTKKGIDDFKALISDADAYNVKMATSGSSVLDWLEQSLSRYFTEDDITDEGARITSAKMPIDIFDSTYTDSIAPIEEEENDASVDNDKVQQILDGINYRYGDEALTQLPQKFTATDLAKDKDLLEDFSELFNIYLTRPEFMHGDAISGKQIGDAYHHTMEHIDYNAVSLEGIKEQLIRFKECGIINDREYKVLKPERLAAFFTSELGKRVCASPRVEREYPVFMEIPYNELGVNSNRSDIPVIQGIADLFFFEGDEIVLVDYKSDTEKSLAKFLEGYKKQVAVYKAALEKMFATKVKQCFIYSFSAGREIDIT